MTKQRANQIYLLLIYLEYLRQLAFSTSSTICNGVGASKEGPCLRAHVWEGVGCVQYKWVLCGSPQWLEIHSPPGTLVKVST